MDEPFGALDALTRETLQQELVRLCGAVGKPVTVVMITNNVEEAILLSDRIVPLSRGPAATLGAPIPVALPRPRTAAALLHDDSALRVRSHIIEVLTENSHRRTNRPPRAVDADRPALEALRVATSEVDGR
jgi:nitrate/nitrite transport system ATP-binding protein